MINNKYAIIENGGKQYKIFINDIIKVDNINIKIGKIIIIKKIIMLNYNYKIIIGNPYIKNTFIIAIILEHLKYKKKKIFKIKRRKHYKKSLGYRQKYTKIKILSIFYK
ncbi:50S ribosomal subunit protein L21 [Candidatus Zinderia insecticola CARI]|uniref:Large ribosomal subunit protein bL21 n=1 Tax=Zinderia insecticola (strain CARI) TaxID=871271 RepID=E0TJ02_ZINIC|nr:50S ribosomal subunit protein L21 [Candidatus Zinderia insecticola CARI]